MATKIKTTGRKPVSRAKKPEKRGMTRKEYRKLFDNIGAARVFAYELSQKRELDARAKRALRGVEQALWNLGNKYPWSDIVED